MFSIDTETDFFFYYILKAEGCQICVFTEQVDFINNKDGHFLNIAAILPAAADSIPLLWSSDNQISLRYGSHVRSHITRQLYHPTEEQRK